MTWAIIPYVPQAPFSLYAGREQTPVSVPSAKTIIDAVANGGDSEFDYIVQAKVRPVLLLTDSVSERYEERLALRLTRLAKYSNAEQETIRAGENRALFYVDPTTSGLREEGAVLLDAPVRVHASALHDKPVGGVNAYELRTIQERFIMIHGFDVRAVLAAAQQQHANRP